MKKIAQVLMVVLVAFTCTTCSPELNQIVYESPSLRLIQLTDHTYIHESFLQTEDFGNVSCNGLVYFNEGEAIVFDTPADDKSTSELINWITNKRRSNIKGIVPTHFHRDCVAGLELFHEAGVMSFANVMTRDFLEGTESAMPKYCFESHLSIEVGAKTVDLNYLGEGHTADNIVGYIPEDNVLFGGCLIKSMGAGKGYTGDANLEKWSETVYKVKTEFKSLVKVVPGHGDAGGMELLDFTIDLFDDYAEELHGG